MKRVIAFLTCLFMSLSASAQFTNGQVLTAPALNAAIASPTITGGSINGANVGAITPGTGNFTTLNSTSTTTGSLSISGGLTLLTPLSVPNGGTGFATLTNHGVLIGAGASALTQSAVGTTGQVFLGNTGADPTWGTIDNLAVGAVTPNTGAFTTLSASSTVSGAGFVSRFASPGPIGNTAASSGAFTTLSATGAITPNSLSGIVGTSTNDSANAGSVGEYVTNTGTGVSITTATPANITTISLSAGDWFVYGNIEFIPSGGTFTVIISSINTTSATQQAAPLRGVFTASPSGVQSVMPPPMRISLTTTTTIYLVGQATFSAGTATATGIISARRVR